MGGTLEEGEGEPLGETLVVEAVMVRVWVLLLLV